MPLLFLVACGGGDTEATGDDDGFSGVVPIFTPGQGGSAYILGGAIANQASDQLEGAQATVESTTGTQEIVQQVSDYGSQERPAFGLPDTAGVYRASVGEAPFEEEYSELRALGAVQESALYFVTRTDSNIESLSDLDGSDVGLGVPGSGVNMIAQETLAAHGVAEGDFNELALGYDEVADSLANGSIDAGILAGAEPISAMQELATQHDVEIIPTSPEAIEQLQEDAPYVLDLEVDGGQYQGIEDNVDTVGFGVVMMTHQDTPDDLVEGMMDIMYGNTEQLVNVHSSAEFIDPETAQTGVEFEFHPAAVAYLQDEGVEFD